MNSQPKQKPQLSKGETDVLRVTMHDVQMAVADYYAATGIGEDLGRPVRAFLVGAQTLNEHFTKTIADAATYNAFFVDADRAEIDLLNGIKYARNVAQHVLHIIRPSDDQTLVGGTFGLRLYTVWDEIPADTHARLHKSTQKLKSAYDIALREHDVLRTMLALLRFYAGIAPDIVHHDFRGEWTGFPLMSQPGMSTPLHPEEPSDAHAALAWLNSRRPGGDTRLVCGQYSLDGVPYAFGHTFIGEFSFAPWIETVAQVNEDIELGYRYRRGDPKSKLEDVSLQVPAASQGGVLKSKGALDSWTQPVSRLEVVPDWCVDSHVETWQRHVRLERGSITPASIKYGLRRARRLNALVPPRCQRSLRI